MNFLTLTPLLFAFAGLAASSNLPVDRQLAAYNRLDGLNPAEVASLVAESKEFFAKHDNEVQKRQRSCADQCYYDWCSVMCDQWGCQNFGW